jgi:hypothetical protein
MDGYGREDNCPPKGEATLTCGEDQGGELGLPRADRNQLLLFGEPAQRIEDKIPIPRQVQIGIS